MTTIVYSFKFIKIFLSQLMAAGAIQRQYLRTESYVAKEEAKAEINCPLSSSRENDVATAQLLFTSPFTAPLFLLTLVKWHKRSLKQDEAYNNANCQLSAQPSVWHLVKLFSAMKRWVIITMLSRVVIDIHHYWQHNAVPSFMGTVNQH